MGKLNSSVTRVWPVFDYLLYRDATGQSWLPALLRLCKPGSKSDKDWLDRPTRLLPECGELGRDIPKNMFKDVDTDGCARLKRLRNAFEKEFQPSTKFLRWMIEHPHRLTWPKKSGKPKTFGEPTQSLRTRLMNADSEVRAQALTEFEQVGAAGSRFKWWAFEGWTYVDCWLETDRLTIFIEGKRTDSIDSATDWYPARNQIARNLEVAAEIAGQRGKEFGVIVCAEQPITVAKAAFDESLPHFSPEERDRLWSHYLGCITWTQVRDALCPEINLPKDVAQAIGFCSELR